MKQIGLKGEKICSGQEISDGRMDKRMDGRTDRLITIGHTQSGALIIATSRGTTTMPITSKKSLSDGLNNIFIQDVTLSEEPCQTI